MADVWRKPAPTEEGEEYLIKFDGLFDADWNPKGVSVGVIQSPIGGGGWTATCATWCDNNQDHYHTVEIEGDFLIADIPS